MDRLLFAGRLVVVLALVASTQGLLFVQGAFELRQEWVAENLCVNRDRPELHCDGKCVLSHRLHQEQERQDEQSVAGLAVALAVTALVDAPAAIPPDTEAERPTPRAVSERTPTGGEGLPLERPPRVG